MTEVKKTIVRSKRKNQSKELERCKAIYGEENTITIDRTTKWGSPFAIGKDGSREEVMQKHQDYLRTRPDLLRAISRELSGKVLVCWCWPDQCHGDILAYLANNPDKVKDFEQGKNPMKGKVQSTLGSFE
ncbi:MAG: DUF4326 domain-containing protein [Methanosarcina sp.]|jgi:hypothetical protein|nr:DUF4326 domain-containing protein [Methanosarcina sp.]MDD3318142.1 DUF4326 domain-containing protein [Methanosarcina sp.]MDD4306220.1 DUF4326 domain-containing protein [Methanosarcina sp.]MDD4620731.1 DUF4326 domain-containing protein [Methanosarcina sp.]NLN42802.1 DUF4326 domain-containing protein [Methanosarcina sp.]